MDGTSRRHRPESARWAAILCILTAVLSVVGAAWSMYARSETDESFGSGTDLSPEVASALARWDTAVTASAVADVVLAAALVVGGILLVFIAHAWLALRKFPANFRQYRAFAMHRAGLRHDDTGLWWIQLWTGFALFFLGTIHLYGMLTQPELIGPYESADRIWTGSKWTQWENLGGELTDSPAAVSWDEHRIDVFARGTDGMLYQKWWDGTSWQGWTGHGAISRFAPAVSSRKPNHLDVYCVAEDNSLWHRLWTGSNWSNWETLGGVLTEGPAAVSWDDDRIDVFGRGTDNAIYHTFWED